MNRQKEMQRVKMRKSKDSGCTDALMTKKNTKKFKTPKVDISVLNSRKKKLEEEITD